ncbi:MAG: hypothetical protein ACRC2H_04510 [Silanimonas sp.]
MSDIDKTDASETASLVADAIDDAAKNNRFVRGSALASTMIWLIAAARPKMTEEEWRGACELAGSAVSSSLALESILSKSRTVTEEVASTGSATAH